ncbi:PGF-CTERM sorting domain-containing protein, partial [Halopiger djelfimassiliensis]
TVSVSETSDGDDGLPGFGPAVALIAIVAAIGVAVVRRQ